MPRRRSVLTAFAAGIVAVALTGCAAGPSSAGAASTPAGSAPAGSASASAASLPTVVPGILTIATGQPAYSPWVEDDAPQTGKGFEAAVADAVAAKLGYDQAHVKWVRTGFDAAIAPGPKTFDVNIQQFSITDARKKAVDFSSPYYTTTQAVVTTKGTAAASATTYAALKGVKIGVAAGTTSYTTVSAKIGVQPQVFNSVDDAVLALKSGQVQALVTDLPGAFYIAGAELKNGVVSAQFPADGKGDQFAFVLAKGSALTAPVSAAVDAIRKDGELASLTTKWLSTEAGAPVLK